VTYSAISKKVNFLQSLHPENYQKFLDIEPLEPFSKSIIDYLSLISKEIFKNKSAKKYSDLLSFAFFCREANLNLLEKQFKGHKISRLGKGIIFHITPSNVPMNFAYSLVAGLLAGNSNLLKLPSKEFDQINIFISIIKKLSKEPNLSDVSKRVAFVKYDIIHKEITDRFSLDCDIRVIWGGDKSIRAIRKSNLNFHGTEIIFPDKYSFCVIHANTFLKDINKDVLIKNFYNDTYLFDQNACTSPHLIIWIGKEKKIENAKSIFWDKLHALVKNKYDLNAFSVFHKLTTFCDHSSKKKGIFLIPPKDNLIWRVKIEALDKSIENHRSNSGYFLEYDSLSLNEISNFTTKKFQTMSYYGFQLKELKSLVQTIRPKGIDRIVPVGRTMDFSLYWDGKDLINSFSRIIDIN